MISKENVVNSLINTTFTNIPILSFFTTFYNEYINSQWQDRIEKILKEITNKIKNLSEKEKDKIKCVDNFASILKKTITNSSEDIDENKIQYYTNSVINIIKSEDINNSEIHIFLNYLKDFSILHLKVLEFLNNSKKFHKNQNTNPLQEYVSTCYNQKFPDDIIKEDCPDIIKDKTLLNVVMKDLNNLNLFFKSTKNNLSTVFLKIFNNKNKGNILYFLVIFIGKIFKKTKEKLNFC